MTELTDINELFSRDPMKLTDDDITKIVAEFRKRRNMFKANPASIEAPKKLTDKERAASSLKIELDL